MDFDWTHEEHKKFLYIRQNFDRGAYLSLEEQQWLIDKLGKLVSDEIEEGVNVIATGNLQLIPGYVESDLPPEAVEAVATFKKSAVVAKATPDEWRKFLDILFLSTNPIASRVPFFRRGRTLVRKIRRVLSFLDE